MKQHPSVIKWAAAFASAVALFAARPCAADVLPNLLNLPSGYQIGAAFAVNANGVAAGIVVDPDNITQACLWTAGTPTTLPNLLGYVNGSAGGINSSGVIVGECVDSSNYRRAVRWVPGAAGSFSADDLGLLPSTTESTAAAINDEGQVLCEAGDRWFLWESGTQTEITMPNGGRINAEGTGLWSGPGLLSSNGRVAGRGDVGHKDGNGLWVHETYQAVLWQKTATGVAVTPLSSGGSADRVYAISTHGMVAGYSSTDGYFVYDSNTATHTYMATVPTGNPSISYTPMGIFSVNDQGQAVFMLEAYDGSTDTSSRELWVWQADDWTQVPVGSLAAPGDSVAFAFGVINNNGQVAGSAVTMDGAYVAFGWSASQGIDRLLNQIGTDFGLAIALNDSGLVVGGSESADFTIALPVTWDLSTSPVPQAHLARVRDELVIEVLPALSPGDKNKLQGAINHLNKALEASRWLDASHPKAGAKGESVFEETKSAVLKLEELRDKNRSGIEAAVFQAYIHRILALNRELAVIAIDEAKARGGKAGRIKTAEAELIKGDEEAGRERPGRAIDHYKNSWKNASAA